MRGQLLLDGVVLVEAEMLRAHLEWEEPLARPEPLQLREHRDEATRAMERLETQPIHD
jgi:hypothetical protein